MEKGKQEKVSDVFQNIALIVDVCFLAGRLSVHGSLMEEKATVYLDKTRIHKLFKQSWNRFNLKKIDLRQKKSIKCL